MLSLMFSNLVYKYIISNVFNYRYQKCFQYSQFVIQNGYQRVTECLATQSTKSSTFGKTLLYTVFSTALPQNCGKLQNDKMIKITWKINLQCFCNIHLDKNLYLYTQSLIGAQKKQNQMALGCLLVTQNEHLIG